MEERVHQKNDAPFFESKLNFSILRLSKLIFWENIEERKLYNMGHFKEDIIINQLKDPKTRRKAFEIMVNQYSEKLYWQIRRIVNFHDDADDVLQNTFLKAWTNIESFRNDSKLYTWLSRIAINESLSYVAKQKNNISIDQEELGLAERLESDKYFDGNETQAMLQEAVAQLPDKQKAVFNLKYFQEMKYEDISQVFGTSVGALKASYHLAVKKIEDYFNKHD